MLGFDLFGYIRRKAAESVVQGVSDGVKAITPEGEPAPANLDELRAMLASTVQPKQLAAKADDADAEPARRKGK